MEKTTEYGNIKISDNVFERLIKEGLSLTEGRDSLVLERKNIIINETDNELLLEFHVVHKFGTSMFFSTRTVLDYIEKNLKGLKLGKQIRVVMRIVAIKARRSFKTNHEITRVIK